MVHLSPRERASLEWLKRQLDELPPRWLRVSRTSDGLFHPHLDRQWQRLPRDFCTPITQNRLVFNFSLGYRSTGQQAYLDAVHHGASAFVRTFWDHRYGGWFHACRISDGAVIDERKDAYSHAFAIFGLAHAALLTGDPLFTENAWRTLELLHNKFQDPHGGYVWWLTRKFQDLGRPRSQNPMMHLFEALLVLAELDKTGKALTEAQTVADFVLARRRKADRALPEWFRADWSPLPTSEGGVIDVGHAFEWAFLLSSGVEHGLPTAYLGEASSFLELGLTLGYDEENGGVLSPVTMDGDRTPARKGWWEQCESTRAILHHAYLRGNPGLTPTFLKMTTFIQKHFVDPQFGGWFIAPASLNRTPNLNKGFEGKVDYHVLGMAWEATRTLEVLNSDGNEQAVGPAR